VCDPVTLTIAATAVTAAGTLYGGYRAKQEGDYNAAVARNNATLEQQQAADALARGRTEEVKHGREVARLRAMQIAAFAANGLDTSFGSAADIVVDGALIGAEDAFNMRENTQREARGYLISAQNLQEEARQSKRAGRDALIGSVVDATGTVLSGASQVRNMKPIPSARGSAPRGAPAPKVAAPAWAGGGGGRVTVF
jgi:hypothetical protein